MADLNNAHAHEAHARERPQSLWEARFVALAPRRARNLEQSRQIVDAAYRLLEEGGAQALTIRAVLASTGLSRRAFYGRFADKDELMLAVFEELFRVVARQYSQSLQTLRDPLDRLKVIVVGIALGKGAPDAPGHLNGSGSAVAMSREHLHLAKSRPQDLQAALSPVLTLIAQQLEAGMQAGLVRQDDCQRLAALIYNLVATTVQTDLLTQSEALPDWPRRQQLAGDIWEFCRRAITI
jgi:AcrR family transcriptional regulator